MEECNVRSHLDTKLSSYTGGFLFLFVQMWQFDLAMILYDGTVGYVDEGDKMRFDTIG